MKQITSILVGTILIAFLACKESKNLETKPVMTGNDKDSHGCIGSAGYTWSELKQDCIRIFELPLQLVQEGKSQIAGVVFSSDKLKAEVFTGSGTFILSRKSDSYYMIDTIESKKFLEKQNGKWVYGDLTDKKVQYKEE